VTDRPSITELAGAVFESSKETTFSLMRANYVERDAWEMPGGKIRGLAPEASDIAVALRDSIWARFDSLRFHDQLITQVLGGIAERVQSATDDDQRFNAVWTASWHAHYLLDDLVFNAASLFDYIGNAVWFGFHGQNHIKKKWKKTYQAAKSSAVEKKLPGGPKIYSSATGAVVLDAHADLVNDLYEYRSDLIHNRLDGPEVFRTEFWRDSLRPEFTLPLPEGFSRRLGKTVGRSGGGAAR